jgi:chitosanase
MPLSDLQKKTAQAIVNIFETGKVLGDYGAVTVMPGDKGHLTYGRNQVTLSSGGLHNLLAEYCAREDAQAQMATQFQPLLPRFLAKDLTLDADASVKALLREAGKDPVMHAVQDEFFDKDYWVPSWRAAAKCGLTTALSTAVVYDGHIHGNFGGIRNEVDKTGTVATGVSEKAWIAAYVATRKAWLLRGKEPLPRTVYRMEAFKRLIEEEKWDLPLPLVVRGVSISEKSLSPNAAVPADGVPASAALVGRTLRLAQPLMKGEDVRALQAALNRAGFAITPDGVFGPATEALLKQFQRSRNLTPDGVAGPRTQAVIRELGNRSTTKRQGT